MAKKLEEIASLHQKGPLGELPDILGIIPSEWRPTNATGYNLSNVYDPNTINMTLFPAEAILNINGKAKNYPIGNIY